MGCKSRNDLIPIFAKNGKAIGVEIGVCFAAYSNLILSNPGISKLYSVDPWVDLNGNFVKEAAIKASEKLKKYGDRSVIKVGFSLDEVKNFKDNSLDFVYIDGDHSYKATAADIAAWWSKVKPGGILAGHDYKNNGNAQTKWMAVDGRDLGRCGVKKAVNKWAENNGLKLYLTEEHCKSWYFFKT